MFISGGEPLNGNCSVGQLTTEGYIQHLTNGDYLSRAYVHTGFLEPTLTSDIYIRSDGMLSNILIFYKYSVLYTQIHHGLCRYGSLNV